ncbi:hypothetical protein THERMOT_1998 [Bathymodiolus thermophilus thioautotrophic gill symbiont]|nr:hypothetical protein THERMOT_1998 [Bathymodiolus thermophilus thioautotrophic gill symbiont]
MKSKRCSELSDQLKAMSVCLYQALKTSAELRSILVADTI